MKWLFWPVSVAVMTRIWALLAVVSVAAMSRTGRYLLCEVAVLARIAGRYEPYCRYVLDEAPCWALCSVRSGCSGP